MSGERIEALIAEIRSSADGPTVGRVEELVEELVDLYGTGLSRIVSLLHQAGAFTGALRAGLTGDPLVSALLTLHGLHPDDTTTRVQAALDRVRPYLASHAGGVSLLGIEAGVARIRLEGSCDGCASSTAAAGELLERAVQEAAPEVTHVELERGPRAASDLVQLRRVSPP
jgi:Fe-S cluster biogenesis protein NfuA